jgi:hypothetical protein
MRRDSAISVAQGKGQVLSRRRRGGGLTCSEGQVDDVLSKGESTEVEVKPSVRTETVSTATPQSTSGVIPEVLMSAEIDEQGRLMNIRKK